MELEARVSHPFSTGMDRGTSSVSGVKVNTTAERRCFLRAIDLS